MKQPTSLVNFSTFLEDCPCIIMILHHTITNCNISEIIYPNKCLTCQQYIVTELR